MTPYGESTARVLAALDAGEEPARDDLKASVKELLRAFAKAHPGRSVEVRVPPFAAVQCFEGPRHTRGTPPNVVETEPITWVMLATGRIGFGEAKTGGLLRMSGSRADLSGVLGRPG